MRELRGIDILVNPVFGCGPWFGAPAAGDPGSVGLSRSPGHPGFGLVYPGSVGLTRFGPGQTGLVGLSWVNPG